MLYNLIHALAVNVDSVLGPNFLFCLVIFFGFVVSLKLEIFKWDSPIAEGFIFEVSSLSVKRREAEKMETRERPVDRIFKPH